MAENEIVTRLRFSIFVFGAWCKTISTFLSWFHFFPLPLFPSSTEERKTCLKKYVKEDLTPFFKLNQHLNRASAQSLNLIFCICILILHLFCHTDKLHDYKNKKIQSVESNGEEA